MVFITSSLKIENMQLLRGSLLSPITETNFRRDAFKVFLVSDRVREIVCERPQYHGGIGTSRGGTFVMEFETKLCGVGWYEKELSASNADIGVIENNIELVTSDDVSEAAFPAFLSTELTSPPKSTKSVVRLNIKTLAECPEMRLYLCHGRQIHEKQESTIPIGSGIILPVSYNSGGKLMLAAMEVCEKLDQDLFAVAIYHETASNPPAPGDVLERKVVWTDPKNTEKAVQFNARIGVVEAVRE